MRTHSLEIFVIHGINVVYTESPINVFFNDLLAVTQHKLMNEVFQN